MGSRCRGLNMLVTLPNAGSLEARSRCTTTICCENRINEQRYCVPPKSAGIEKALHRCHEVC